MSTSFHEEELAKFFDEVPEGIGDARKRFNPFELFRPGEVDLTRIMADLLNPEGSHGCADLFLAAFLTRIREARFNENTRTASVEINDPTGDGRLIDITISSEQFVLGIENKPWADEGQGQVRDYLADMEKRKPAGDYKLLYLSGNGEGPQSLSREEVRIRTRHNQFQVLPYWSTLEPWLEDCEKECVIDDESGIHAFLGFFRRYVQAKKEAHVIADHILKDHSCQRLRLALAVANSMGEVRERVFRAFAADVKSALEAALEGEAEIEGELSADIYSRVFIRLPKWPYSISIEKWIRDWDFIFGLRNEEENPSKDPKFPGLEAKLKQRFGPGAHSRHWEWFVRLRTLFGDGQSDDFVLEEICRDPQAAIQKLVRKVKDMFELVRSAEAN